MDELISLLQKHRNGFAPVVKFNPETDSLLLMDFTENNKELGADLLEDTTAFTHYITAHLKKAGAKYGIGGYNEHRTVYSRSRVFDDPNGGEPRRLHLGTDIWAAPETSIAAPMDGIVHSFAFNNNYGDYGSTIILTHNLDGIVFHTLYGHLTLSSIRNIQEGDRIQKGDIFAGVGISIENGQWPPHLHLQLIADMGEWNGDYPGVCRFSEKERWLANSPDPDLVLGLNEFVTR
jgi:murein DD-endopeptidase MepM/ murein hydrolase activator NlpD